MGLGQMGEDAAQQFLKLGFDVYTWSRTPKDNQGMTSFHSHAQLHDFLACADILVCLLPLTPETENILNARTLQQLPKGAYVINVARGGHINDEDLIDALDSNHLSGATLDTFRVEPLPANHPFWTHPKITITPHVASITDPSSVAEQIVANYHRAKRSEPLLNQAYAERGY